MTKRLLIALTLSAFAVLAAACDKDVANKEPRSCSTAPKLHEEAPQGWLLQSQHHGKSGYSVETYTNKAETAILTLTGFNAECWRVESYLRDKRYAYAELGYVVSEGNEVFYAHRKSPEKARSRAWGASKDWPGGFKMAAICEDFFDGEDCNSAHSWFMTKR